MFTIWIGYDSQFQANISPQLESIRKHSNGEFSVRFLHLNQLSNILYRDRDPKQSTDSAFTRWLVPYLADYQGWHLYMDSDMMVRKPLSELIDLIDDSKAVMVVKHGDQHGQTVKFNGHVQTAYDRKNWSSLMLFNADRCRALTVNYINKASGLYLHQFKWLDEGLIGQLPAEWNYLVGVNEPMSDPAVVHWTLSGPWVTDTEFSSDWLINSVLEIDPQVSPI
jgi:lipopolysaccharide biosynthesis glycosyltransferase